MKSVTGAAFGSLVWLVLAPGTLAVYLPWAISGWRLGAPFLRLEALRWLGAILILLGLPVLIEAFVRFVRDGRGTPVPLLPPDVLVVRGFYRHVRNPMYVGVVALIVGQALLLGDARLLAYAAAVALCFHLFVRLYEEPHLARRFGSQYAAYRAGVRRWLPRLRGWSVPPGLKP